MFLLDLLLRISVLGNSTLVNGYQNGKSIKTKSKEQLQSKPTILKQEMFNSIKRDSTSKVSNFHLIWMKVLKTLQKLLRKSNQNYKSSWIQCMNKCLRNSSKN